MSGLARSLFADVRHGGKMVKVVDVLDALNALKHDTLLTISEAAILL